MRSTRQGGSAEEGIKCMTSTITKCVLWAGRLDSTGYGQTKGTRAHRWVWQQAHGPIPKGLWVDHVCRVRACVNVEHLRLVTPRQNTLENNSGVGAVNAKKTHCKRGHALSGDNIFLRKLRPKANNRGNYYARTCIECAVLSMRQIGERQRKEGLL